MSEETDKGKKLLIEGLSQHKAITPYVSVEEHAESQAAVVEQASVLEQALVLELAPILAATQAPVLEQPIQALTQAPVMQSPDLLYIPVRR